MTYTVSIRLNGITTPYTCHDCCADVAIQHGAHPDNPKSNRHYYKCDCGSVGMLYPLFHCEDCNRVSSEGGELVTYRQPQRESVAIDESILWPEPIKTAVQLRLI